jgi:GTPase SAR1 family protein
MGAGTSRTFRGNVILIGSGGSGRSTLIQRLLTGNYTYGLPVTHIAEQHEITFNHTHFDSIPSKSCLKLSIVDYCGHSHYTPTLSFLTTDKSIYVIFYDMVCSYDVNYINSRVENITNQYGNVPILLVGLKADVKEWDLRVPFEALKTAYPHIVNTCVMSLSSKTGEGISEFVKILVSTVMNLDYTHTSVPYSDFEKKVQNMMALSISNGYVPQYTLDEMYKVYDQLYATRCTISAHEALQFAISMGTIIMSPDEKTVIDRMWFVRMTQHLITHAPDKVKKNPESLYKQGRFKQSHVDMETIWDVDDGYTRSMHYDMLSILRAFKLISEPFKCDDAELYNMVYIMRPCDNFSYDWSLRNILTKLEADVPLVSANTLGIMFRLNTGTFDQMSHIYAACDSEFIIKHELCSRSCINLHDMDSRAYIYCRDSDYYVIVRGINPMHMRNKICSIIMNLWRTMYPYMNTVTQYLICHRCKMNILFNRRDLAKAIRKKRHYMCCNMCTDAHVELYCGDFINPNYGETTNSIVD